MIDPAALAELRDALDRYANAGTAWERRIAAAMYEEAATPRIVGPLLNEYVATLPTTADLDAIAADMRHLAIRIESFGVNTPPPETAGIVAVITITGAIERNGMAFMMQVGQQVEMTVSYQDRHGNAAEVESQQWASSDDTVVTVTDNGDGTAVARTEGTTGTAQVTVTADARFGDDVSEIRGVLDVEVVAAEASVVKITPGEPTDTDTTGGGGGGDTGPAEPTEPTA